MKFPVVAMLSSYCCIAVVTAQSCSHSQCGDCVRDSSCVWCSNDVPEPGGGSSGHCVDKDDNFCEVIGILGPSESSQQASPHCNYAGHMTCSGCECETGFAGSRCDCPVENDNPEACKREPGAALVCEGRGECVCGVCDCAPLSPSNSGLQRYSGRFCECDDYSCDYTNGQLCGGPERGMCRCGQCVCQPDYDGEACDCPLSPDTCLAKNGLLCNGKGSCVCGRCVCDLDDYFRGPTCEDCPSCAGACERLRDCVMCQTFGYGPLSEEQCLTRCQHVAIRTVETLEHDDEIKTCRFLDEDGCVVVYGYHEESPNVVMVESTLECPPPARYVGNSAQTTNKPASLAVGFMLSVPLLISSSTSV